VHPQIPDLSLEIAHPGYRGQAWGLAEHARVIAKRYRVPVIAEVFRAAVTYGEVHKNGSLKEYIAEVRRISRSKPFDTVGPSFSRSGWIELHYDDASRLRDTEVPEVLLSTLETDWLRGRTLTLVDYSKFASTLQAKQASFFDRENLLVRFPALPLRTHLPHLRLVGSLLPNNRESWNLGVDYTKLSGAQKLLFERAFRASLFASIIRRDKLETFLRADGAMPITFQVTTARAPGEIQNLELIRPPGAGNHSGEMIRGGTLVQFRFNIEDEPAILTAIRLLVPTKAES
jgi:hypothetical protein